MILQNVLHLVRQIRIYFRQPLSQVFMHRAFGDAEFFGDRTHRMASSPQCNGQSLSCVP